MTVTVTLNPTPLAAAALTYLQERDFFDHEAATKRDIFAFTAAAATLRHAAESAVPGLNLMPPRDFCDALMGAVGRAWDAADGDCTRYFVNVSEELGLQLMPLADWNPRATDATIGSLHVWEYPTERDLMRLYGEYAYRAADLSGLLPEELRYARPCRRCGEDTKGRAEGRAQCEDCQKAT